MSKSDEIRAALREADEPIDSQQIADECPSVTSNSEASALLNYMVGNGTVKKSLRADGRTLYAINPSYVPKKAGRPKAAPVPAAPIVTPTEPTKPGKTREKKARANGETSRPAPSASPSPDDSMFAIAGDGTLGIRAGDTQVRLAKPLVQRLQAFLKTTAPLWQ